jgi:hypothetical protein
MDKIKDAFNKFADSIPQISEEAKKKKSSMKEILSRKPIDLVWLKKC